jgi:hypothetical protein
MKEESASDDINPEQLRRLFSIGRDTKKSDGRKGRSQQKADMLCRSLSQPLPLDKSQIDMLPSTLGQLCHSIGLLAGETISELLTNPSSDIAAIRRIKRYSKGLSAQAKSTAENDVAIAIYYAAIAHALVFHDRRITRFSFERLESSFSCLVKEKWISKDLSVLLKAAGKCCKEKARS